jgi:2-polyprenyl-3-methyl-5-hydroxy-6-metoxy-1,4-benzoquinol methylase
MHSEFVYFPKREDRADFIARRFQPLLQGSILDVGCDQAYLRSRLTHAKYFGVDIGGQPDLQLNLETVECLPFEGSSYDCVLCIEVLEHLNNLHLMFDELVRVSSRHIIVSLPNCWGGARKPIERGIGSFAHYGLPVEKPIDRHKWFFSLTQAETFFRGQAERHQLKVLEMFATEKPRSVPIRLARRLRYPQHERYLNRYSNTLWAVLQK